MKRLRKISAGDERLALHQDQMAADIERWCFLRQTECIFKCVAVGHQGCRSENTLTMRMNDSGVDIAREAEIVGVDDQPLQLENVKFDA